VQILESLETPSYIADHIRDDPATWVDAAGALGNTNTTRNHQDHNPHNLKNASLVCRSWRRATFGRLFSRMKWVVQDLAQFVDHKYDFLAFVRHHSCQGWPMSTIVNSLTVVFPNDLRATESLHYWDGNWMWKDIFGLLDPLKITLIGGPLDLGKVLGLDVEATAAWAFDIPYHILQLERPSRSESSLAHDADDYADVEGLSLMRIMGVAPRSLLFGMRPWRGLLINEGSFLKVYTHYEFFNYPPPSLLTRLLPDLARLGLPRSILRSFSYVGVLPLSHHVWRTIVRCYPGTEHFYIRLTPRSADFYKTVDQHSRAALDLRDPWVELDDSYRDIWEGAVALSQSPGWQHLRTFESGDGGGVITSLPWDHPNMEAAGIEWAEDGIGRYVKVFKNEEA
jgi:hypothetical protein